ncbi:MAG: hypothetical protein ACEQSB_00420 [Undibacterium sp.]
MSRFFNIGPAAGSLPTPSKFPGASDNSKILNCALYAQANDKIMNLSGYYVSTGDLDLPGDIDIRGVGNAVIDASQRVDVLTSSFTRGTIRVKGSVGAPIALNKNIVGGKSSVVSISKSGTTATIVTYAPHKLTTGDFAWIIFGAAYTSLPAGGLYFVTQSIASEMMAYTAPVTVVVTNANTFSYTVDVAAPASISASSMFVIANDRVISTVSNHGLVAGDSVEISSDKTVPAISGYQAVEIAEAAKVTRVISPTIAVLDRPLKYSYQTSLNAEIRKLVMPSGSISDVTILGRGSTGTVNSNDGDSGLSLLMVDHFTVNNVTVKNCEAFSFSFHQFGTIIANGLVARANFSDDAGRLTGETKLPYAIAEGSWFDSLQINDADIVGNFRHGICEATESALRGISGNMEVNNPKIVGSLSNCIATHYPNDGFRLSGGFLSGSEYGLDARAGDVYVEGTKGWGGYGLLTFYGFCDDVVVRDVRGGGYSREMISFQPTDGALYEPSNFDVDGVKCDGARRVVAAISANTTYQMTTNIRNIDGTNIEFEHVYVNSPASKPGRTKIKNVTGSNGYTSGAASLIPVSVINHLKVSLEDIDVEKTGGQTNYAYSLTNCTGIEIGRNVSQDTITTVALTIVGGAVTINRTDDFTAYLRGEGLVADDLDQIIGLKAGQRIRFLRYSETITIRDQSVSGLAVSAGAIQTPSSAAVVVSGAYNSVEIEGVSIVSGIVYPVVVRVATA